MSKADLLQKALRGNSVQRTEAPKTDTAAPEPATTSKKVTRAPSREGKEHIGAWMNPDFGTSLRMVQLRRRKDAQGNRIYLVDLMAEALNDLFLKYDVPTVHHE